MKHFILLLIFCVVTSGLCAQSSGWHKIPGTEKRANYRPKKICRTIDIGATACIINRKMDSNKSYKPIAADTIMSAHKWQGVSDSFKIEFEEKITIGDITYFRKKSTTKIIENYKDSIREKVIYSIVPDKAYKDSAEFLRITMVYATKSPQTDTVFDSIMKMEKHKYAPDTGSHGSIRDSIVTDRDISLTRHQLKKIYDLALLRHRKNYIYLDLSFMPSFAANAIVINDQQFTHNTELDTRRKTETANFGWAASLATGVTFKKAHTIFVQFLLLQQGFKSEGTNIDWHTGLTTNSPGTTNRFHFISDGVGIGYNYSPFNHVINQTFELGAFYTHLYSMKDNVADVDNSSSIGIIQHNIGCYLSAGISIRPRYWYEFKIMPTILYDFSHVNTGDLRTKLYNIGITVGYSFHL